MSGKDNNSSGFKVDQVRKKLGCPIIDTDIHPGEFLPDFLECLEQVGGVNTVDQFQSILKQNYRSQWYCQSLAERRAHRTIRPPWWIRVADAKTIATLTIPQLLRQHLEDAGIDYAILHPISTIMGPTIGDGGLRRAICRAANVYHANIYAEFSDRMTSVAAIPMHTPTEAIEELEYAVNILKFKAVQIPGCVRRPIKAIVSQYPELINEAIWIDTFGLDSEYDYDPFWEKCVELKVSLTTHAGSMGWTARRSTSNFVYNHIGHFSSACEALCKSLFLGGVTHRYPTLKFAFLEANSSWASSLLADLLWHWERRSSQAINQYNPMKIDQDLLGELYRAHGKELADHPFDSIDAQVSILGNIDRDMLDPVDEFDAVGIQAAAQIYDRFVPNFYFGCFADDLSVGSAFDTQVNPFNSCLNAVLGSDCGHWDAPDISAVASMAYGLVEQDILSEENLKDFLFANPVRFYGETNPGFFNGTSLEREAVRYLAEQ